MSEVQRFGDLEVQQVLMTQVRQAQAAGDAALAAQLAEAKRLLAQRHRGSSCRSCGHWQAQERYCPKLACPASPIQGCGYHTGGEQ